MALRLDRTVSEPAKMTCARTCRPWKSEATSDNNRKADTAVVTYTHFLTCMWQPVVRHIADAATADKAPVWTEALGLHHAALQQEMLGKVAGPEEILPIDDWVELVRLALRENWK